jgi:bifunctional DNA-binding transcriptional regulator/antitoxin component of YhaV-PrlF toxin-antitoxin module
MSEREFFMPEYLQVGKNGQITLLAPTRRKAKIAEGDLLEAVVDTDGIIRLVPKLAADRTLAKKPPPFGELYPGQVGRQSGGN